MECGPFDEEIEGADGPLYGVLRTVRGEKRPPTTRAHSSAFINRHQTSVDFWKAIAAP
jgi:hypothetical protein